MDKKMIGLAALVVAIIVAAALFVATGEINGAASLFGSGLSNNGLEMLQFGKNLDIWFMLMLVAFLMIFIRKFEWGVCLAVLLSAAGSFVIYLALMTMVPINGEVLATQWTQGLLIQAVICAITVVIAIGVFLGTCKMWQYFLVGVLFAFVYYVVEAVFIYDHLGFIAGIFGGVATDPGGSILVHMCAAYFGLGVALGIREKRAFNEPMYTTTHSVTFVWLASMLLWMLWPSFVTSLMGDPASITWGTVTCYMAGMGSLISTYIVCVAIQGKVNPLIYTYAMLCGPVAIGAPLLSVGPWGALLIGLIAGAVSALCFIYLQPWLCSKLGILDVMGVHNLHGVGGWMGAIFVSIVVGSFTSLGVAVLVFAFTLITGFVVGFIVRMTRGEMADEDILEDDVDFIKSEKPADA